MSSEAMAWAPAQDCPNPTAKAVLKALAPWVQPDGCVWTFVDYIALDIQKSARSVQRGLADLRAAGLLIDTGEWHTHEGKRLPIYKVPLDQGFANLRQRMQAERRGDTHVTPKSGRGVTPMSPQAGGRGDTHVTPRGDTHVTQLERDRNTFRSSSELPQGAGARDEGFDEGFAAYPATGQDRTHLPQAQAAWAVAVREVGAPALVAAVRRYTAEDRDVRRGDHGAPGFHGWLEGERWRRWLSGAGVAAVAATRRPFAGPAEVFDLVADEIGEEQAGNLLQGAAWDEAAREIRARTSWSAGKLGERLAPEWLADNRIRITHQPAKVNA